MRTGFNEDRFCLGSWLKTENRKYFTTTLTTWFKTAPWETPRKSDVGWREIMRPGLAEFEPPRVEIWIYTSNQNLKYNNLVNSTQCYIFYSYKIRYILHYCSLLLLSIIIGYLFCYNREKHQQKQKTRTIVLIRDKSGVNKRRHDEEGQWDIELRETSLTPVIECSFCDLNVTQFVNGRNTSNLLKV